MRNHGVRYYGLRKDAVKAILQTAQTRRDFDNIIQHMSPNGSKCTDTVTAENRKQVRDFLNMALVGTAKDGQQVEDFYNNLQASLKSEPTRGFPMFNNDSPQYAEQRTWGIDHSMLADIGSMGMPPTYA